MTPPAHRTLRHTPHFFARPTIKSLLSSFMLFNDILGETRSLQPTSGAQRLMPGGAPMAHEVCIESTHTPLVHAPCLCCIGSASSCEDGMEVARREKLLSLQDISQLNTLPIPGMASCTRAVRDIRYRRPRIVYPRRRFASGASGHCRPPRNEAATDCGQT